jgi:hypothetical protein
LWSALTRENNEVIQKLEERSVVPRSRISEWHGAAVGWADEVQDLLDLFENLISVGSWSMSVSN